MKTLNDLGLCKKSHKKVEDWLQGWLDLFIKQANKKDAWVYRANFEENDFFYFTDCKDILEKDPEAKGQENNLAIRSRKRKILLQLFVKTILGQEVINSTIKCGHCGFSPCWIDALGNGTGHWTYCPKCKKTEIQVFPEGYDTCVDIIKAKIYKKFKSQPLPVLIHPDCKKFIKEIQSYKYDKSGEEDLYYSDEKPKKRKVPKGAWSMILLGKKKCRKCGSNGPFQYTVDLCDHCYCEENHS